MSYYDTFRDLYADTVTADVVAGATPAPGWLVLRCIPKRVEAKKGGILVSAASSNTPVVYEVLLAGEGCRNKAGDLVCIVFLSGDKLSAEIVLCQQDDIMLTYGYGLRKDGKQE
jgi:hypothetical protein